MGAATCSLDFLFKNLRTRVFKILDSRIFKNLKKFRAQKSFSTLQKTTQFFKKIYKNSKILYKN
jgi:TRAP-type C4-dicarboxylate transport system substrate-binding protein